MFEYMEVEFEWHQGLALQSILHLYLWCLLYPYLHRGEQIASQGNWDKQIMCLVYRGFICNHPAYMWG